MTDPIDYGFRPASYWEQSDPESLILGNIKGQLRREMVRDFLHGRTPAELGRIEDQYLADEVDDEFRSGLGRIHPHFMGGEYLPGYLPGEVEIARVVLQSATLDVHSIRARRRGARIHYRMVDEYGSAWTLCRKTSRQPLTFGQLVDLIQSAQDENGLAGDYPTAILDWDADEGGSDPEEMAAFVSMESVAYPQLGDWWNRQAAEWLDGRRKRGETAT